jgi:hypothetical protein
MQMITIIGFDIAESIFRFTELTPLATSLTPQPEGQHEQRDAEHQCAPFDCLSYSIESSHRAQAKGKHDPRTAVEN